MYANGWSAITEIIARGEAEGNNWNNSPGRSRGQLFDL